MALNPHSEQPDLSVPDDYRVDHPDEHPPTGAGTASGAAPARVAGLDASRSSCVLMITATHYNESGTAWLLIFAAGIVVILIWDRHGRKNAWRR